ncbi:MAG: hypothetical protein AB1918_15915 [Pseudomonadota bacterium]
MKRRAPATRPDAGPLFGNAAANDWRRRQADAVAAIERLDTEATALLAAIAADIEHEAHAVITMRHAEIQVEQLQQFALDDHPPPNLPATIADARRAVVDARGKLFHISRAQAARLARLEQIRTDLASWHRRRRQAAKELENGTGEPDGQ